MTNEGIFKKQLRYDIKKSNEVDNDFNKLLDEWRKEQSKRLERHLDDLLWDEYRDDTWEGLTGDLHIDKVNKKELERQWKQTNSWVNLKPNNKPMNDNITVFRYNSKNLAQAFADELEENGYKDVGNQPPKIFEYGDENNFRISLDKQRKTFKAKGSPTCADKTFQLETQWNEALEHATKQIEPKFEIGDWVVAKSEGGNDSSHDWYNYPNRKVRAGDIAEIKDVDNNTLNVFGTAYRTEYVRKATPTEIEQAKPKTFFDWDVNKFENETTIGCQTFNDDFLQELTEAIYNLEGDVSIRELQDELYNIGFKSQEEDLPF